MTMSFSRVVAGLALLAGLAAALPAHRAELERWEAIEDSLRQMPPRLRGRWLRERSLPDPMLRPATLGTDSGLSLVGRWSYGPAYDVDCRMTSTDTLIALARGSGVSLLSFSRSQTPRLQLLSDVNAERWLNQVMIRDTLLYVGTNAGLETYDISDVRNPVRLSWIGTGLAGFDIKDSLAFITWYDTFKVYSIADPARPYRVGSCADSGATVSVSGNTAYLADWGGLYAVDVSDPAHPHRVGSWGGGMWCASVRGNLCCAVQGDPMNVVTLDISDPAHITPLGTLTDAGGYDIHLDGATLYASGRYTQTPWFQVIDIGDSTDPTLVGRCALPGYKQGAWGKSGFAYGLVANDLDGLVLVDLSNPGNPTVDTLLLGAGSSDDIALDGARAYVANGGGGLKVLDITDPARPQTLGSYDTSGIVEGCYSVAARDSFAYVGWFNFPPFRSIDVSDPTNPRLAVTCNAFEYAQDMVMRDSFVFCADHYKFEVVNVARPREPRVVGTVNLPDRTRNMFLRDTLTYVAQGYSGLRILSVAQPSAPREVGFYASIRSTHGIWVDDTLAYIAEFDSGLTVVNVARPDSCYKVGSRLTPAWAYDVEVSGTSALVSCRDGLRQFDISNPRSPVEVAFAGTPSYGWRVERDGRHIYVACMDAGVAVYETVSGAVAEPRGATPVKSLRVWPSVTRGRVSVSGDRTGRWRMMDVTGRRVMDLQAGENDVSRLGPGVYIIRGQGTGHKIVITR